MQDDRSRWDVLTDELGKERQAAAARKTAARADFDRWLVAANGSTMQSVVPAEGLRFHVALSEGQGRAVQATVAGRPVTLTAAAEPGWEAGQVAAHAFQRKPGSTLETADAGDFKKDQSVSYGAWIKLGGPTPGGSIFARMDDQHDFRGWDVWIENGKIATHIIHKWPEDALKVVTKAAVPVGQWHHVFVVYRGSANPEGVSIYIDGVRQDLDTQVNALKGTIRTTVPL